MLQEQLTSSRSSSSALDLESKEGLESDDEIRRVPEFVTGSGGGDGLRAAGPSSASRHRKLERNPADREHKRLKRLAKTLGCFHVLISKRRKLMEICFLRRTKFWGKKRLLRNRVSAQEARERKKAQLRDLEERVKELGMKNMELEERLSTLQNENQMLRQILKSTTANRKGSSASNGESLV